MDDEIGAEMPNEPGSDAARWTPVRTSRPRMTLFGGMATGPCGNPDCSRCWGGES
ncbi:hypothetical protein GCM10018987_61200 [Streptomyces cremeus]